MTTAKDKTTTKEIAHWLLSAAYAVIFTCGGFIINMAFSNIERVEARVNDIPITYVLKSDYKDDQQEIMVELRGISEKIAHNAEYMEADYNRRMDKIEALLQDRIKAGK